MKTLVIYFLLFAGLSYSGFGQNNEIDSYNVGFQFYKTYDASRQYISNDDTTFRPLLIHHWYPCAIENNAPKLSFKNYIDLIAIRDDYSKAVEEVDQHSTDFINAYLGFAKQHFNIDTNTTTQDLLNYLQVIS
jgi:hypothetical protein